MRRLLFLSILLVGCRTADSEVSANRSVDCRDATTLERSLSLLTPSALDPARGRCLAYLFQQGLKEEKKATKDKKVDDEYRYDEMLKASTTLGKDIYTRGNIIDKKVYIQGPAIFGAHRRLIAAAQEEVLLETYVWESISSSAREILKGLEDLQENRKSACPTCAPVVVRIVANYGPTVGELGAKLGLSDRPSDSGKDARIAVEALKLDARYVDAKVLTYEHKALGTNHAKSLVVDGQAAMITGANPQRFNDPDLNWYDLGFMVGGDVARGFRTEIINNLIRAENGTERDGDTQHAETLKTPYGKTFSTTFPIKSLMADPYEDPRGLPIIITARNGVGVPTFGNNTTQNRAFQVLFQSAKHHIHVQTPNFNDDAAVRGLGAAARRGVKVEMINSKLFNCSSEKLIGQGGQTEKGIARFLREIGATSPQGPNHDQRWFSTEIDGKLQTVFDNPLGKTPESRPNNSHAKFMTVDDEVAYVGSANQDTQSWNQSREFNIVVFNGVIAKAWDEQVFQVNFKRATPVAAAELVEDAIHCQ